MRAVQGMLFYLSALIDGVSISRKSFLNSVRVPCPKQGYNIKRFVLNRACIFGIFLS